MTTNSELIKKKKKTCEIKFKSIEKEDQINYMKHKIWIRETSNPSELSSYCKFDRNQPKLKSIKRKLLKIDHVKPTFHNR